MTSTISKLVAFIIGAGPNVGEAVAEKLQRNGYRVALGSRKVTERTTADGFFHVEVDARKRESIAAAFDTVVHNLGPVNVVVYNAASMIVPPSPEDILSIQVEAYEAELAIGLGAFTAAQKALESFRNEAHRAHPKTFIITGNFLPFQQYAVPNWFTLGIQKTMESRLVATAARSYEKDNFQFYFATLVSETGGFPGEVFWRSGPVHAEVYWRLINNVKQVDWNQQFTSDGNPYVHS